MNLLNLGKFPSIMIPCGRQIQHPKRYPSRNDSGEHEFVWLPAVKREVEKEYGIPWEQAVKVHFQNIRPLQPPGVNSHYRKSIVQSAGEMAIKDTRTIQMTYERHFENIFTMEEFRQLLKNAVEGGLSDPRARALWAPAQGQAEDGVEDLRNSISSGLLRRICGLDSTGTWISRFTGISRPIRDAIFAKHTERFNLLGQHIGDCTFCTEAQINGPLRFFSHNISSGYYIGHVSQYHLDQITSTDWGWRA